MGGIDYDWRCIMKSLPIIALLAFLAPAIARAAEKPAAISPDDAWAAAKSAEIEVMRVRIGSAPSANVNATLIEVDDLLRRFKAAPANQKAALKAQVDTAVARLELESASKGR